MEKINFRRLAEALGQPQNRLEGVLLSAAVSCWMAVFAMSGNMANASTTEIAVVDTDARKRIERKICYAAGFFKMSVFAVSATCIICGALRAAFLLIF